MPRAAGRSDGGAWLVIALAAVTARLAAALLTGGLWRPETFEYEGIARALAAGQGFIYAHHGGVIYRSFTAPLYPWVCAAVYALGLGTWAVILLQIACGAATAALIGRLGGRLFGPLAGLTAGMLVAWHPGLVVYAGMKAHPLAIDALFLTLVVGALIRLADAPSARSSLVAGIVMGLAVLSRPTFGVALPIGLAWMWLRRDAGRPALRLGRAALLLATAGLIVLPWVARNVAVHRRLVLIQTTNWEVFWRGNNPHATGHSYVERDELVFDRLPEAERSQLLALPDEPAQEAWFRERALAFVREQPRAFVALTLRKLGQFWWRSPQMGTLYPAWWRRAYQAGYAGLLAFALLGLASTAARGSERQRAAAGLMIGVMLALSLAQSLHYVEGRHRWAVEPLLIVLAGAGAAALVEMLRPLWQARRRVSVIGG